MERINYRITLDAHKNGIQRTLQGFEIADNMSRRISVNLTASGDTYEIPFDHVTAVMYVTTPNAKEPSIEACTIEDNTVIYDMLPITEEGITEMQMKLIETRMDGAKSVLLSPKFAIEVSSSNADDGGATQTPTFTALEDALARAKSVYDARLLRIEIDDACVFRAYYADGTVYENYALHEALYNGNALLSESWAKGGTGIREGEDTNNSMYFSNVSRSAAEDANIQYADAKELLNEATRKTSFTSFMVDFESGNLDYASANYTFDVNENTGNLEAESDGSYAPEKVIGDVVNDYLKERTSAIDTLEERMNAFTSLEEGSTTGDAELVDARVDKSGKTHANVGEHIRTVTSQLSSEIVELENTNNAVYIENLANREEFVEYSMVDTNGTRNTATKLFTTGKIAVKEGEKIWCTSARFITVFRSNDNPVNSLGVSLTGGAMDRYCYVVPSGIAYIIITSYMKYMGQFMVNKGEVLSNYIPYGMKKDNPITSKLGYSNQSVAVDTYNVMLELDEVHHFKNKQLGFYANISSFTNLTVGHGYNMYGGNAVEVDNTNIKIVNYDSGNKVVMKSIEHGFSITDRIGINIFVGDKRTATVMLTTSNGGKCFEDFADLDWRGNNGKPFAVANGTFTNCKLTYNCTDYNKEIYAFGDSYFGIDRDTRWVSYLAKFGFDNWLVDSFGGRNSTQALVSLKNTLKYGQPKYILWCLGMNDNSDNGAVDSVWKSVVDEVVSICKIRGIEPILCTIPNVPAKIHSYKNEYVKSLGFRYIDFAKAVGAESDNSGWYDGLLSSDNLHPSINGAMVLANQAMTDVPELMSRHI